MLITIKESLFMTVISFKNGFFNLNNFATTFPSAVPPSTPQIDLDSNDPLGVKKQAERTKELIKQLPNKQWQPTAITFIQNIEVVFQSHIVRLNAIKAELDGLSAQPTGEDTSTINELSSSLHSIIIESTPTFSIELFCSAAPNSATIVKHSFNECVVNLHAFSKDLFAFAQRKIILMAQTATSTDSDHITRYQTAARAYMTVIYNAVLRSQPLHPNAEDIRKTLDSAIRQKDKAALETALKDAKTQKVSLSTDDFYSTLYPLEFVEELLLAGVSVDIRTLLTAANKSDQMFQTLLPHAFFPLDANRACLSHISSESFSSEAEVITAQQLHEQGTKAYENRQLNTKFLKPLILAGMKPPCPTEAVTLMSRHLLFYGSPIARVSRPITGADYSAYKKGMCIREVGFRQLGHIQSRKLTEIVATELTEGLKINTNETNSFVKEIVSYFPTTVDETMLDDFSPEERTQLFDWCIAEEAANKRISSYALLFP